MPEKMSLWLLVESIAEEWSGKGIQLNGKWWRLVEDISIEDEAQIPPFTCISYVWGQGRQPNPIHTGYLMSDRTLSALATAMQHGQTSAYWIDAFCIPPCPPEKKRATLESMGFIYSLAAEVVVSLDGATGLVVKEIELSGVIGDEGLAALENDSWVESVWTYQEIINSGKLRFVPRNWLAEWFGIWSSPWTQETTVLGRPFFNALGYSLSTYRNRHGITDLDLYKRFPRLDALVETLADWESLPYNERSALQIMSNMDRRRAAENKYRFYSMLGSITQEPCRRKPSEHLSELAETFMEICEKKNDFSFIYSAAPHDKRPGYEWRPRPGQLPSLMSWYIMSDGQRGYYDSEGFWLDDTVCLQTSTHVDNLGLEYVLGAVRHLEPNVEVDEDEDSLLQAMGRILRRMDFSGSITPLRTSFGAFFPQTEITEEDSVLVILISAKLRWRFGGPGFVKIIKDTDTQPILVPGVFVGETSKEIPSPAPYLIGPKGDSSSKL